MDDDTMAAGRGAAPPDDTPGGDGAPHRQARPAAEAGAPPPWSGRSGEAWLLTDPRGEVFDASGPALALLAGNRSVLRRVRRRLHSPQQPAALTTCLACAIASGASALALPRPGRLPLTLRCEAHAPGGQPAVLRLTLRDPEAERLDLGLLQSMFDLTPAEAGVAAEVANGCSTAQIAATLGIQPNTVLTHVKKALLKTGTRRQAELVSLLLRSAAVMTAAPMPSRPMPSRAPGPARPGRRAPAGDGEPAPRPFGSTPPIRGAGIRPATSHCLFG